jgi:phosphopantetheinyl transferase
MSSRSPRRCGEAAETRCRHVAARGVQRVLLSGRIELTPEHTPSGNGSSRLRIDLNPL